MSKREKVIKRAAEMIAELGVKSLRVDDLASDLGISKRTLYEMFGDKEELLSQSMIYLIRQRKRCLSEQLAYCNNMLEVLLESVRSLSNFGSMQEMEKRLAFNLKKFYPNVYDRVKREHTEQGIADLQYALDKCMEEGYLDPMVDVELMARLFLSTSGVLFTEDNIIIPDGVSREEAIGAMTVNFLRGLASEKGLKIIDELLAREPRPKTLAERRILNN